MNLKLRLVILNFECLFFLETMMGDSSPEVERPKPRGRKRRAATEPIVLESMLMQYMLERFVWGFVSPAEVQRVAAYMKQDIETAVAHASEGHNVVFPQVNHMEKLGNHGQNSQNMPPRSGQSSV